MTSEKLLIKILELIGLLVRIKIRSKIKVFSDVEMYKFVEKQSRRRISYMTHSYCLVNSMYKNDYSKMKEIIISCV